MALSDIADLLRCPVCLPTLECSLVVQPSSPGSSVALRCRYGHNFDTARQGQLNLLGGPAPRHADTAAMVAARDRVLSGSAYAPVLQAVAEAAARAVAQTAAARAAGTDRSIKPNSAAGATDDGGAVRDGGAVLDCGAGTGHYLAAALKAANRRDPGRAWRGVALDISAYAARRAARWPLPIGALVADAWRPLPLRTAAFEVVMSVFAPRQPAEFARVLRSGGALIVAHPAPDHLLELRDRLGLIGQQPDKAERLETALGAHFGRTSASTVRTRGPWSTATIHDVVGMGPNAFHGPPGGAFQEVDGTDVTVAVEVSTWQRTSTTQS